MVKIFGANPMVSRTTIAAINKAQVNISIRAKVPKISLGFASMFKAYCEQLKNKMRPNQGLSVEVTFVMALFIRSA